MDDDPQVCEAVAGALQSAGYDGVLAFLDGRDALEAIESAAEVPALVVLDLFLFPMSGRELLVRLRVGHHAPNVPVLILSSVDAEEADVQPWPIAGVLETPISVDRLLAEVAAALGKSAG